MQSRTKMMLTASISLLLLAAGVGCDSGNDGEMPKTAKGRLTQTTESLPSDTDFIYAISDLAEFRSSAKESKATIDRLVPMERIVQPAQDSEAGSKFFGEEGKLRAFDEAFWKESGIMPDGGFALGMVDYNTVLLTYVDDKKKFEDDLLTDLEVDAEPSSSTIAGKSVKTVESDNGQVIWNYNGDRATVVFPDGDEAAEGDEEKPPSKETFTRLANLKAEKSLAKTDGFKNFKKAAGQRPALAYAQLGHHIKRGMVQEADDQFSKDFANNVEESLNGFGFILETEKDRINVRMWTGLTDKGKKRFDELFRSPETVEWGNFVSSDTLLSMRAAGNWKNLWKSMMENMPEKDRKEMEQNFKMASKTSGIDIQKDIIDNLTGQAGLMVYGIGGEATPQLMSDPSTIADSLEAMYVMEFGDKKVLKKLVEKANAFSEENVELRPLKTEDGETNDAIDVIEVTVPEGGMAEAMMGRQASGMVGKEAPVRFYVHGTTIAIATTAIAESKVQSMLTGEASNAITDSSELDLGGEFAGREHLTGLYINFDRFRAIFGKLLSSPMMASVKKTVDTLQEAMVSTEEHKHGAWIDLNIDLVPKK